MGNGWKAAALLIATFLLAALFRSEFLLFLLGFELLLYPAAFVQACLTAKKVSLRVTVPQSRVVQGESFQIRAELENAGFFPVPRTAVRLAVRVFPEREELLLTGKLMLNGGERGSLCFQLDGSHCACLEIRPDRLVVTDLLGIFQCSCRIDREEITRLFVLPGALRAEPKLPEGQGALLQDNGDRERRGFDSPDVSEIRSYRSGDSLKRVHWKLSARQDALLVKELSEPVKKLTWLYLNLQESSTMPEVRRSPERWDHFLERAASVSASLLNVRGEHMVFWVDSICGKVVRCRVGEETDLQEMLCALLRTDTCPPGEHPLLKEKYLDETQETCLEIDLQGNLTGSKAP